MPNAEYGPADAGGAFISCANETQDTADIMAAGTVMAIIIFFI
jgi:hypothetical protein